MRRIDARRKNASALRLRFSQSLATAAVEPGDGALDNPTAGKHHKSFGLIGALDDFSFELRQEVREVPDSRRRQTASSRTDTSRTEWQEAGYRRRDPGYRRGERWRGATNPAYLQEGGASCL